MLLYSAMCILFILYLGVSCSIALGVEPNSPSCFRFLDRYFLNLLFLRVGIMINIGVYCIYPVTFLFLDLAVATV